MPDPESVIAGRLWPVACRLFCCLTLRMERAVPPDVTPPGQEEHPMLTRTLATLTLLLALNGGADPAPRADTRMDRARALEVDDVGGCREAPAAPVPVAPASCSDEGRP